MLEARKVMSDNIIHTNNSTYKILTENMELSNSTKISSEFATNF